MVMTHSHRRIVQVGSVTIGGARPLVLIAGPCVIEDEAGTLAIARQVQAIAAGAGMPFIFKASYDKANRTSMASYRGPGLEKGLAVLERVRRELGVPVLSDVHGIDEIDPAARVLDVLQVPAFLCRQTDFLRAVARAGKPVNVKKGQFLAPHDMPAVIEKITATGNHAVLLTERGASFGYNNLVADLRSLVIMRETGYPVIFDATHSVQLPGGLGNASGGERAFVAPLALAATAVGIDGLFLEVHPCPAQAACDGPNSLDIADLDRLLQQVRRIRSACADPPQRG
jgi:2-dehydro-3-deoxyphosphooctonate aldolase (KDO 8-P synthase)